METKPEPQTEAPKTRKIDIKLLVLIATIILLLGGLITALFTATRKQNEINKLVGENFSLGVVVNHMPNQACAGINAAIPHLKVLNFEGLSAGQTMYNDDPTGKTLTYYCHVGNNTKDAVKGLEVAEIDSNGYEMGAEVTYFHTSEQAEAYASSQLNPKRYWTVFDDPLNDEVATWQYYTSYVFGSPVYFDSYAVKNNAIVRLSLPCGKDSDSQYSPDVSSCMGADGNRGTANEALDVFTKNLADINF